MAKTYQKLINCRCRITKELYNKFLLKIRNEGWTIQQAIATLILEFTNGNLDIEVPDGNV